MMKSIDLALGMATVFFLFSVVCSLGVEWIAAIAGQRAATLKREICALLGTELGDAVYKHPLITTTTGTDHPSQIDENVFATALIDLTFDVKPLGHTKTLELRSEINDKDHKPLDARAQMLLRSLSVLDFSTLQVQQRTATWFTNAMRHLTGKYKRLTHRRTLAVAAVVTLFFNLDAVQMWRSMRDSDALTTFASKATDAARAGSLQTFGGAVGTINVPIGWHLDGTLPLCERVSKAWQATHAGGLIVSWLALLFGAPFWFDFLKQWSSLRLTGQPTATTLKIQS